MAGAVDVQFTLNICSNGVRIQAVACVRVYFPQDGKQPLHLCVAVWETEERHRLAIKRLAMPLSGNITLAKSVKWSLTVAGRLCNKVGKYHLRSGLLVCSVATIRMPLEKRSHGCPFLVIFKVDFVQVRLDVFIYVIQV